MTGCGRKIGPYKCCTVICGDCLVLMRDLPDSCVDLVYADPPFNTGNKIGWKNRSYGPAGNDNHSQEDYEAQPNLFEKKPEQIALI